MHGKNKKSRKEENISPVFNLVFGSVTGSVLYFCLLAFFALTALKSGTDSSAYMPVGMFLGALTGIAGSIIAVRPLKRKGALFGAVTGLLHSLICSLVLFVVNKGVAGTGVFILIAVMIAGGIAGGIIAVNLKFKKRY